MRSSSSGEIDKRAVYLEAMALGLGADPLSSRLATLGILAGGPVLVDIIPQYRGECSPELAGQIETVGGLLLRGSEQTEHLEFTVGSWAIALSRAAPESALFQHVRSWVGLWTDGAGLARFDEAIEQYK